MRGVRQKLTYANVMSTLAVFGVVIGGGVAIAAVLTKNSVKSRHIAPKAVKTSDLGRNAATGAKVREATLAQVPAAAQAGNANNAGALDGIDSLGFARPSAAGGVFSEGTPLTVNLPGLVNFAVECDDAGAGDAGDKARFAYSAVLDTTAYETVSLTVAPGPVSFGQVLTYGKFADGPQVTDADAATDIVYRLHRPSDGKGVVIFAHGQTVGGGSPACQGSIHAFRVG